MTGIYASYPVSSGGASPVPTYATLAVFPSAIVAGNGAVAIALDTNILYESDGSTWIPIAGPGVILSVGTFDSGTPSANGAHVDNNQLIMQSASATVPGLVNISTQTFAGVKTFNSAPILNSLAASLPLQLNAGKSIISAAIDLSGTQATGILAAARFPALTGDVTTVAGALATSLVATSNGTLTTLTALTTATNLISVGMITAGTWQATPVAILYGGTGQTTAAAAFNALNPMTTTGDTIYEVSNGVAGRRAIGSTGDVYTVAGGVPVWAPPAFQGTVTSVGMTVPAFLSIAGSPVTSSGVLAVSLSGAALPVANGGTGQTTAAAAFNALSPMTTAGDIIVGGVAGAGTRFAVGSANQILGVTNAATGQEYKTLAVGTSGTDFAIANAANLVTFNLPDASATARGVITTGTQTIAGNKTFTGTIGVGSNNSGTWTPTVSSSTGTVATPTVVYASYIRLGNIATLTAGFSFTKSGSTVDFTFSLPTILQPTANWPSNAAAGGSTSQVDDAEFVTGLAFGKISTKNIRVLAVYTGTSAVAQTVAVTMVLNVA